MMNTMKTILSVAVIAVSGHTLAAPGKAPVAPAQKMMHVPAHAQSAKMLATQKAEAAKQHGQQQAQAAHAQAQLKQEAAQIKVAEVQQTHLGSGSAHAAVKVEKTIPTAQATPPANVPAVAAEIAQHKSQAEQLIQQQPEQAKPVVQPQASQTEVKKEKKGWFSWFKKSA